MTEQTFKLDNAQIPNDTILIMGISYDGMGQADLDRMGQADLDTTRGRQTPKVFTYALLKAGGLWYTTGAGRVPQAAGWLAVMRWLEKDNRRVQWVKVVTGTADLWPVVPSPVDTSQASV